MSNADRFALRVDGVLRFSNDTVAWPARATECIAISGAFVAVHGRGTIDGQGAAWWPNPNGFRPYLIGSSGNDMLVRDVTIVQSPMFNLQLRSTRFEVVNCTILAWPPCPEEADGVACAHNT